MAASILNTTAGQTPRSRPRPEPEPAATDGPLRKSLESVHLLALGVWLGSLVMAGATAAIVFPTAREDLAPMLPRFEAYDGSHADITAGMIQNKVFLAADAAQFVCGTLALASALGLLVLCKLPVRRWSSAVRLCGLGISLGLASYNLMVLGPRMQTELRAFWAAAEAGENALADQHKQAFGEDHPVASNVLGGTAAAVAFTLIGAAWSAASSASTASGGRPGNPAPRGRGTPLPEPTLAKGGGV
ncbi:MAG: DUF4149 domain-containing protein [Planctomycetota bacterium]